MQHVSVLFNMHGCHHQGLWQSSALPAAVTQWHWRRAAEHEVASSIPAGVFQWGPNAKVLEHRAWVRVKEPHVVKINSEPGTIRHPS